MFFKAQNDDFTAGILYQDAVREEKEWRMQQGNQHDVMVLDEMLSEVRKLGYKYRYYADITNRTHCDEELLKVLLQYIGRYDDEGISAELVGVVGRKSFTAATEIILNNYRNSSERTKCMQAGFYDNALYQISDKRFIDRYIEILKSPHDAAGFPLTMRMLAKWGVADAKPYFWQYLSARVLFRDQRTADLEYTAMEALSYYTDEDGSILRALENKSKDSNADIAASAKRAIKRLQKKSKK